MADSKQSKWLDAPKSTNTVRVRMIDTTSVMLLHSKTFVEPVVPGHETMSMTDVSFLIENPRQNKKAVFDLGVRKDFWNLPRGVQQRLDKIALGLRVDKDVPEILQEKGVDLESINHVIWSHSHFDHVGDVSLFPKTTTLVHGPDISKMRPGYPSNPDSNVSEANFEGREVVEIEFSSDKTEHIGGFAVYDFYGDSSLYLLETPGHSRGHMCALARVSSDEDGSGRFVLLGGDVCHFCGDLRPNETYQLPAEHENLLKSHPRFKNPPATLSITSRDKQERRTTPWYALPTGSSSAYDFPSPQVGQETVNQLAQAFDEADNVLLALAHDRSFLKVVPVFNVDPDHDLNGWYEKGLKAKCYWLWINELDAENVVDGFWKDGKRYDTAAALLEDVHAGHA